MEVFRFQTFNQNNLDAVRKNKFWFSTVDKFDDPLEFSFIIGEEFAPQLVEVREGEALKRFLQAFRGTLPKPELVELAKTGGKPLKEFLRSTIRETVTKKLKNSVGVCCFFPTVDKALQWSHYADGHRGFAIAVGSLKSSKEISLCEVKYDSTPPVTETVLDLVTQDFIAKVLSTKDKSWKDQKEYRFLISHRANNLHPLRGAQTKAIYFGCRMSDEHKSELMSAGGTALDYFDTTIKKDSYTLEFQKRTNPVVRTTA